MISDLVVARSAIMRGSTEKFFIFMHLSDKAVG